MLKASEDNIVKFIHTHAIDIMCKKEPIIDFIQEIVNDEIKNQKIKDKLANSYQGGN